MMCRSSSSSYLALVLAGLLVACSSTSSSTPGDAQAGPDATPTKGESPQSKEKEKDPSTALVVGVDADDFRAAGFVVGQLEITVTVDGQVAASETLLAEQGALFPHELKVNAPKDKPDALVEIEVVARDRPDPTMPPIVTRRASTRFVAGSVKLAYVRLEIRCNTFALLGGSEPSGPTCSAPTTCVAGRCVASDLPPLIDYRADWTTSPPSACGAGAPEISEIAQGETTADLLPEGATLSLEQGAQCGHHLWLGLRMKNLAQAGTLTTISATQPGSAVTAPATAYPYTWAPSEGGTCELSGLRFQLDNGGAQVADFLGKPLDLVFELKDKAGHTATSKRRVNIAAEVKVIPGNICGVGRSG
jgi:hypothetical protein